MVTVFFRGGYIGINCNQLGSFRAVNGAKKRLSVETVATLASDLKSGEL